jgi:hypothetical protein
MGQDNGSEEFHRSLRDLLDDREVMVRRNAALALVRFQDASGRGELLEMLRPYALKAPAGGTVSCQLAAGGEIGPGALAARIRMDDGGHLEVRAPFSGRLARVLAQDGSSVAAGETLLVLSPTEGQVWEALRGLYLVGQPEDLPEVERYAQGVSGMPARVREQAMLAAQAIRTRSERGPSR